MGVIAAAIVGVAAAGATAYVGSQSNKTAEEQNEAMRSDSKEDYTKRLSVAQQNLKKINQEFNKVLKERPNTSWESFIKSKLKSVNDPAVRDLYVNGKAEDFAKIQEFAQRASEGNVDNFIQAADEISGGRWNEFINKRNDLVATTDAASRYQRAYELSAPIRGDASTVRYDNQGRLIEGQRADKQAFNIATEVQTGIEQEQKNDLRLLENDRASAAASQLEKASQFTSFFDATGYASKLADEQMAQKQAWQAVDESRHFDLYKMFAGSAAGITAVQPNYVDPNQGNAMIAQGIKMGTDSVSSYYKNKPTTSPTSSESVY